MSELARTFNLTICPIDQSTIILVTLTRSQIDDLASRRSCPKALQIGALAKGVGGFPCLELDSSVVIVLAVVSLVL